jgi:hypothetical protein
MVLLSFDRGAITIHDLRMVLGDDGRLRNLQWNLAGGEGEIFKLDAAQSDDEEPGEDVEDPSGELEAEPEPKKRPFPTPARYIISFKDRCEARRFVREWHRRPFPTLRERNPGDESPPIAKAELLW